MEILSLGLMLVAFLLGLGLGGPYIRLLRDLRIGKSIRAEGPQSHFAKQGTPTMGGALVIAVVFLLWGGLLAFLPDEQLADFIPQTIVPMGALLAVGALGLIDDLVNVAYGFGIRGRHKLVWQLIVAFAGAVYIQRHFGVTGIYIPLAGEWEIGAAAFIALAAFVIVGTSNGVNLTDGLDGLAGGTLVFSFLAFAFIAAARGFPWLTVLCVVIVGALLAFLWFNAHPAEFFMGDVGALSLGAALASTALVTGFVALLAVAGIVFVAVTLSVIVQVGSYKIRKKRVFRMAPIQHHFEAIGWPEEKVTIRFWLISALGAIVAAVLAFATPL